MTFSSATVVNVVTMASFEYHIGTALKCIKTPTIIFTARTHGELCAIKVIFTVHSDSQWPYWNKTL